MLSCQHFMNVDGKTALALLMAAVIENQKPQETGLHQVTVIALCGS